MDRKPDVIRALLFLFAVGLAITGFTSLQATQDDRPSVSQSVEERQSETGFYQN